MQRLAHCVWEAKGRITVAGSRDSLRITAIDDKLYSPQMVVTANTAKYSIENDLTKKKKEKKKKNEQTNTQTNGMYLSKTDQLVG